VKLINRRNASEARVLLCSFNVLLLGIHAMKKGPPLFYGPRIEMVW